MPVPIPFSVAPAVRANSSNFTSSQASMVAGYTTIYWELNIPSTTDYENGGLSFTAALLVNGAASPSTWVGGHFVNKGGTVDPPPPIQFDISGVTAGSTLQVKITIPVGFNIGIQNGLIS